MSDSLDFHDEVQRRTSAGESVQSIADALGATYSRVYDSARRRGLIDPNRVPESLRRQRWLIAHGLIP